MTQQLHLTSLVAAAAIRIIAASQAATVGMEALMACEGISQQLEHPEDVDVEAINECMQVHSLHHLQRLGRCDGLVI